MLRKVLKMDDDTFLVMPNVINNLSSLDCSKAIYWGTTQGANEGAPTYAIACLLKVDLTANYIRHVWEVYAWPLLRNVMASRFVDRLIKCHFGMVSRN